VARHGAARHRRCPRGHCSLSGRTSTDPPMRAAGIFDARSHSWMGATVPRAHAHARVIERCEAPPSARTSAMRLRGADEFIYPPTP
jgi:hypothetical protein